MNNIVFQVYLYEIVSVIGVYAFCFRLKILSDIENAIGQLSIINPAFSPFKVLFNLKLLQDNFQWSFRIYEKLNRHIICRMQGRGSMMNFYRKTLNVIFIHTVWTIHILHSLCSIGYAVSLRFHGLIFELFWFMS